MNTVGIKCADLEYETLMKLMLRKLHANGRTCLVHSRAPRAPKLNLEEKLKRIKYMCMSQNLTKSRQKAVKKMSHFTETATPKTVNSIGRLPWLLYFIYFYFIIFLFEPVRISVWMLKAAK